MKVLFVCIENSNRSQMAQAFVNIANKQNIAAYSAGSNPSGIVNPKAIVAMQELGYDLSKHTSKSLKEIEMFAPFDYVITMGCGDECPSIKATHHMDWNIPDPKNMDEKAFNEIRDLIKNKVNELLN